MRTETLFLDAGGVLVFPNWTRVSETLGRYGVAVSADALQAAEPRAKFDIDQGIRDGNTTDAQRAWLYMELVLENAGIGLDLRTAAALEELRAYHAEHNLWEFVPADVVPALQRLSALGLKLVVVSNANGVLQRGHDVGGHEFPEVVLRVVSAELLERRRGAGVERNTGILEHELHVQPGALRVGRVAVANALVDVELGARLGGLERIGWYGDAVTAERLADAGPIGEHQHAAGVEEEGFEVRHDLLT